MTTNDFEREVDHLLAFLSLSVPKARSETIKNLSLFKGAEPFWSSKPTMMKETFGYEDRVFIRDAKPKDLSEPFDISLIGEVNESSDFHVHRFRMADPKLLRGKIHHFAPTIYEEHLAWIDGKNATYQSAVNYYVPLSNGGFRWIGPTSRNLPIKDHAPDSETAQLLGLAAPVQFSRFYEWRVELGYENCPSVSFATDPHGAKEVFRLRDIPEGKSRRQALAHWVREHWRQKRDGTEAGVKSHIRGAEKFSWNGLRCTIRPSKDDLRIAKDAKTPSREERA